MRGGGKTLAVPDLHAPFMHRDAVNFVDAILTAERPDRVVLLGDVADQHALSRYVRDPAGLSAGGELAAARKQLRPLGQLIPDALVCWGNHDRRVYDRAAEAGIPEDAVRPMQSILDHPRGWAWADRWDLGGVTYEHGTGRTGDRAHVKAATQNMGPTVIAHVHAHAGIHYTANRKHLFWGMNAGCLINWEAYAFAYAKAMPAKPIICVGLIDHGIPRIVPMELRRNGRWVGKL
jgi:predicted phosphodiesterase